MKLLEIVGLIGIGYVIKDRMEKPKTIIKAHPFRDAFARNLGRYLGSEIGDSIKPKITYDSKYPLKKYTIYEDVWFKTSKECEEFKERVINIYDAQEGYITVLQYMNLAGEETHADQDNYGWYSLNSFSYVYEKSKHNGKHWHVSMQWPMPLDPNDKKYRKILEKGIYSNSI